MAENNVKIKIITKLTAKDKMLFVNNIKATKKPKIITEKANTNASYP